MCTFVKMYNFLKRRIAVSMIQDGNDLLETLEYLLLATCYVIHNVLVWLVIENLCFNSGWQLYTRYPFSKSLYTLLYNEDFETGKAGCNSLPTLIIKYLF